MLSLPGEIVAVIQKTVGGRVRSVKPVSGGSINEAYRLELHSGEPLILPPACKPR